MEEALKIAVCEDSPEDEALLLRTLASASISNTPVVFHSGEEMLRSFAPLTYDLLLSDIYMSGISGIEAVSKVRQQDSELPIAFVTSSPDHTLESYRLGVLKYIEKPYRLQDIEAILHLAKINRDSAPSLLMLKNGKEDRVRFSEILYLEQQTHHVTIHLRNGREDSVYDKLSALLPQLENQDFYTPHKSFCVNLNYVRSIDGEFRCFTMADESRVPIRRESMSEARKALEDHLFSKVRGEHR